ncbi:type III pantothenate kinase [Xanthomonas sp. XNM01]|uniref:type III pantothenate kinase n=1 Tax=Xanthomonas sp. XNM01 TaxID=2769289 RepID=UPI0017816180|nr:type III pantothenate kinase [Xanthomonas sp. XNM01]MBD9369663.1 type III pantothenate kinase [Xanthomonas sp. XNM01]
MSDWLFDLGNSRFKAAPLRDDGQVGAVRVWAHGAERLEQGGPALPDGATAWLASVASPALTAQVVDALAARFARVELIRVEAECAGVRIAYADPARFGVDRFLALLAAHALGGPALVVGVGTALTIDLLDASGRHHGGRIAASPTVMRQALQARAAQLPASGGRYSEFADDTADALASGCDGAAVALVERSLDQGRRLLGTQPVLLLHGGGAPDLSPLLPQAHPQPTLVLDGLAAWTRWARRPRG